MDDSQDPGNGERWAEYSDEAMAQVRVVQAGLGFLHAFYGDDLSTAWGLMDSTMRVCWAQWWAQANEQPLAKQGFDPQVMAEELAQSVHGEHKLWPHFSRVVVRDFKAAYPLDPSRVGVSASARPIGLDMELLHIHPVVPDEGMVIRQGEAAAVYPMVMRLSDGEWRVLNWSSAEVPKPGWPPRLFG